MRRQSWRWTVPLVVALGFLAGWLSNSGNANGWYATLARPAFEPPAWVFPVVWSALYTILGFVLADLIAAGPRRRAALRLFLLQLALNLAWSPVFFAAHRIGAALAVILALDAAVLLLMIAVARVSPVAAWALVPYPAWLALATALNLAILRLNG